MKTIEYRGVVDKTDWERGPWDDEPDKVQWQDKATGFPCLIVRGPVGALCGYVGVPAGHPWHGRDYDDCKMYDVPEDVYDENSYVDVHGGLTFANRCYEEGPENGSICHVVESGGDDDVWWLGFDCSHAGDYTSMKHSAAHREKWSRFGREVYRELPYVKSEVERLAAQAKEVENVPVHQG